MIKLVNWWMKKRWIEERCDKQINKWIISIQWFARIIFSTETIINSFTQWPIHWEYERMNELKFQKLNEAIYYCSISTYRCLSNLSNWERIAHITACVYGCYLFTFFPNSCHFGSFLFGSSPPRSSEKTETLEGKDIM